MDNTEFATQIAALNLEGITLTAGVEPNGELVPVTAGFDKMLAAAQMRSLPRVHTILAHPATNLPQLVAGPAETLRSLSAHTLDEAVTLLLNQQNTRWGAIPEYGSIFRQHRNLVGRGWLRQKVNTAVELALADPAAPPYILVVGGPGTGKTAFVADQVSPYNDRGAVYHFIRRGFGQDDPAIMLNSLTAQLLRVHALPAWDKNAQNPAAAFAQTLERVASNLHEGERQLIWIDGLDEAFGPLGAYHHMALDRQLPLDGLPPGIVFVMTSRGDGPLDWLDDVQRFHRIDLDKNRTANLADIREYLGRQSREMGLNLEPGLLDKLAQASEGCFMAAVRYLNPAGDRAALEARIAEWRQRPYNIPIGLEGWLQRQWSILLASAHDAGIDRRVVYAVMGVVAHESGLRTGTGLTSSVTSAIKVAARFLTSEEIASLDKTMEGVTHLAGEFFEIERGPGGQVWYRFFHSRFAEFMREKVKEEAERIGNQPIQSIKSRVPPIDKATELTHTAPKEPSRLEISGARPVDRADVKPKQQLQFTSTEKSEPVVNRWWLRPQGLTLAALVVVFVVALITASILMLNNMAGKQIYTTPIVTLPEAVPTHFSIPTSTQMMAEISTPSTALPLTHTPALLFTKTPMPTSTDQSVFPMQACMTAALDANNTVQECITKITRLPDGRLRLDMAWQAGLQANANVILYPALQTGGMYLSDEQGNRYNPLEAGGAAAQTTTLTGNQQVTGWFIFDESAAQANWFVFHDEDNGIQTDQFKRPWDAP